MKWVWGKCGPCAKFSLSGAIWWSRYSKNFGRTFVAENGVEVVGHMWSNADLSDFLRWHSSNGGAAQTVEGGGEVGRDVYSEIVKPAMSELILASLKCVAASDSHPPNRKNSFEVFGFDFFIDEAYKPWLIEINSSPAVDYSTEVTEAYCSAGLVDSVRVALEWKPWWQKVRDQFEKIRHKIPVAGAGARSQGLENDDDKEEEEEEDEDSAEDEDTQEQAGEADGDGAQVAGGEVDRRQSAQAEFGEQEEEQVEAEEGTPWRRQSPRQKEKPLSDHRDAQDPSSPSSAEAPRARAVGYGGECSAVSPSPASLYTVPTYPTRRCHDELASQPLRGSVL